MVSRPLTEVVEAGWAQALEPVADRIATMGDFLRTEVAAGRTYLPAGENVLRAFKQPFADVRVLIVGQDPYPTPGHAVGLSFSVAPEVRPIPRSLANIYAELESDLGLPRPSNGDLSPWAEQGVLLLNRSLTVAPGRPNSHKGKGWEQFTDAVIRAVNDRAEPAVFVLWGNYAKKKLPLIDTSRHVVVQGAHPSPLSAKLFLGSRPFSQIDKGLADLGLAPIDWRLPA